MCGYRSSSLTYQLWESEIAYLALVLVFGLTFLLYPLSIMIWKQSTHTVICWARGIYCTPFPNSSPGSCGWSKPAYWLLQSWWWPQQVFISLFDAPTESQRRFQQLPDLSNSHHSDLFEMAQGLLQLPFLTALLMSEANCLLILVAVLGGLCGLSQGVEVILFRETLSLLIMVRCTIRFVILYRKGI